MYVKPAIQLGGEGRKMKSKCSTCLGFGLWFDNSNQPMGPLDVADGMPTKKCPECGANANPAKEENRHNITPDEFIKDISK